ncbi:MAG TPA: methyltransferase, partial [Lentimicrobium sp.]|nr:methyltransferase [Lentimicrobium sp.]
PVFRVIAVFWLAVGFIFWTFSAIYFIRNFKPGELLTSGPFAICRNPIYASIILFIIPSLGILFQSGLILSISLVLFINFKIAIHGEEVILRRLFGEQYEQYCRKVNVIVPFI